MWDDHRVLNGIASGLYAAAGALLVYGLVVSIVRLPIFALREIDLSGLLVHTTPDQVHGIVNAQLTGTFFTLDLEEARAAFQKLPWVRRAHVRRQWPDRLEVVLEEHVALARWRDTALVNSHGEVFEAATDEVLPVFVGPEGTSSEVAQRYQSFRELLAPLGKRPVQVALSDRRAWQLKLDTGDVLELGRSEMHERLQRFVAIYERTLAQLPVRSYRIDLRYPNGFALRSGALTARSRGA